MREEKKRRGQRERVKVGGRVLMGFREGGIFSSRTLAAACEIVHFDKAVASLGLPARGTHSAARRSRIAANRVGGVKIASGKALFSRTKKKKNN